MSWSLSASGPKITALASLDSQRKYNASCAEPQAAEAAYLLVAAFIAESPHSTCSISLSGHSIGIQGSCSTYEPTPAPVDVASPK